MTSIPLTSAAQEPVFAVLTTRTQKARLWEQFAVVMWVFCTFIEFPGNELILYPCALLFLGIFFVHREVAVPVAIGSSILLTVPVLGALSAGWSPAPSEAFRVGLMQILHFLIMVAIAVRLERIQIVRAVFLAGVIAIVLAAPMINSFDRGGPYGSKNIFAIRMLICLLASLAVAFEAREHILLRLFAAPVALVALVFMLAANSATALVFALVGILVMTGLWMFWQPVSRVRHLRSFVLVFVVAIVASGIFVLLANPSLSLVEDFLAALGKDTTLTNRTLIWETGNRVADETPLLGLGLDGFWRCEVGAAQTLLELDHKAFCAKHSFHNAYIETRVNLGYVGLTAFVASIGWAYLQTVRGWFRSQGMASSFFLTIATVILASTFTESYITGTFDTFVLLFFLAPILLLAEKYHIGQRQYVRLKPTEG